MMQHQLFVCVCDADEPDSVSSPKIRIHVYPSLVSNAGFSYVSLLITGVTGLCKQV